MHRLKPFCIAASLAWLMMLASAAAPTAPRDAPESRPASRPSGKELRREAEQLAETYLERLGPDYKAHTDSKNHLVYVTALDAGLQRDVRRLLAAQLEAHRRTLFPHALAHNVVVLLPTARDFDRIAGHPEALGQYVPSQRCLVSMTLGSTLLHEFTHVVHHNDQLLHGQEHALWVVEGLATLYQSASEEDGRLVPRAEFGLTEVQTALRNDDAIPLEELVHMKRERFTELAETTYPQARWLALYLQRHEKLESFYRAYKDTYERDAMGVAALEEVLDRPLAEIEADWRKWVLEQDPPWRPGYDTVAHLGIRMAKHERGVRVDGFLRGSAAHRAEQLKVGDVILTVAGTPTPKPRALTEAIRSCRPGQSVAIEVLRDERLARVTQVLGGIKHKPAD